MSMLLVVPDRNVLVGAVVVDGGTTLRTVSLRDAFAGGTGRGWVLEYERFWLLACSDRSDHMLHTVAYLLYSSSITPRIFPFSLLSSFLHLRSMYPFWFLSYTLTYVHVACLIWTLSRYNIVLSFI